MFWWLRRIGSGVGSFLCSQAIFDADWSVSRVIRSTRSGTSLLFPSFPSPSSLRDPMSLFKNQRVLWSFCNCFFLTIMPLSIWRGLSTHAGPGSVVGCDSASFVSSVFSPCPLLHHDLSFHITASQVPVNVMTFQLQGSGLIFQPWLAMLAIKYLVTLYLLSPAVGSWPQIASAICFWCAHLDYDSDR